MALREVQRQRKRERKERQKRERRKVGGEFDLLPRTFSMSATISHLAKPITDEFVDAPEKLEPVIGLTIVAWNVALLPDDDREEAFNVLARKYCGRDREAIAVLRWIFELVAARKQQSYSHCNQVIRNVSFDAPQERDIYFEVMYDYAPQEGRSRKAPVKSFDDLLAEKPDKAQFARALARITRVPLSRRVRRAFKDTVLLARRIALLGALLLVVAALFVLGRLVPKKRP